ncbi:hypothetical protein V6N12_044688 [Hibiscus sabdariffa]|uniref:Uncharacterized protein n=1 Tax=Hibiscus sabdariffa TaxID=183260 RepID=A0ABR2ASP6_9ROSI
MVELQHDLALARARLALYAATCSAGIANTESDRFNMTALAEFPVACGGIMDGFSQTCYEVNQDAHMAGKHLSDKRNMAAMETHSHHHHKGNVSIHTFGQLPIPGVSHCYPPPKLPPPYSESLSKPYSAIFFSFIDSHFFKEL